jgi:hypothetical protein
MCSVLFGVNLGRCVTVLLCACRLQFSWIGESAIALWGYTAGSPVPGMGPDGTGGDQPRFTSILYNVAHEVGIWEKQSSFFFQAESCQTLIMGNMYVAREGLQWRHPEYLCVHVFARAAFTTVRERVSTSTVSMSVGCTGRGVVTSFV